ncbi:hypothetical protein Tco_0978536 [Tanacetum coccineum]|uniref:Uncharacterized protein n=1 Tax=Tanacetum coccineum TaxID=301880 RepID=A0ABQ5ENI0_9ASTR
MQNVENSFQGSNEQYAEIEHAYWKATSVPIFRPYHSSTTDKVEVPKELPKVSMVNTSFKELKRYLIGFDLVFKERTTATAITKGMWGFEHTRLSEQLGAENEHLKQNYKNVLTRLNQNVLNQKEQCDAVNKQVNIKSGEIYDLNAKLQEQGLVIAALKNNEGVVIHMLTEKKYPLKKEILVQMLNLRLESEEESTMALELIRFIKKNKELSIPEQTATGKGTSNPLMAAEKARLLLKKDREYKFKKS